MNEISIDLVSRLEEVRSWKDWTVGDVKDIFDVNKSYTTIFSPSSTDSLNIPETSILNILVLLGAKPNRDSQYLKTKFKFYGTKPDSSTRISDTKDFFDEALASMIEFINVSAYLYDKLEYLGRAEIQNGILKYLIVAAASIYEELYSSRGKIEFAYYFKKLLQHNSDINVEITPYNRESWRGDFAGYTRLAKKSIDRLISQSNGINSMDTTVSNIKLFFGKKTDKDLLPLEERYFIEIKVDYKNKAPEQIFITNFI